eukprot:1137596-Pelagomonas_calceolata.AAC.3
MLVPFFSPCRRRRCSGACAWDAPNMILHLLPEWSCLLLAVGGEGKDSGAWHFVLIWADLKHCTIYAKDGGLLEKQGSAMRGTHGCDLNAEHKNDYC